MNTVSAALQSVYGTTREIGQHLDTVVSDMKKADNPNVARTGHVIESAKLGFGIGYTTPIVIVALGQMILGHPLHAVTSAVSMAVNPFAITCAAVGAIYYGWSALSENERDAIVTRLSAAMDVGVELVRSIAAFVIKTIKDLNSSEFFLEIKHAFSQSLEACSETLSELTGSLRQQLSAIYLSIATQENTGEPGGPDKPVLQQKLTQLIAADRESARTFPAQT